MKKTILLVISLLMLHCVFADNTAQSVKYYEKGLVFQSREQWYDASEAFQQALQSNSSFADAWFHLAQVTYELNDFNLALTYLESAEKYAKDSSQVLNLRGACYISLGELDKAKASFDSVIQKYPNDIDARFGLAELKLFTGNYDGAKLLYEDALKRQSNSRKALLSLALLSAETGNFDKAGSYINQALRYHSNDAAVHFLAAYLSAKENKIDEAEKRLRSAMQIKGDYIQAYVFLANILFEKQRYSEVIDIADYLIKKDRNLSSAWYFKGLAQYRNSETALAVETWSTGLTIAPQDEIMRAALELAVNQTLPVEDERRSEWAEFHIHKAREYSKMYQGAQARYEYQRALRLDPSNIQARYEFAGILSKLRLNELYLNQLKFIKSQTDTLDEKNLSADEAARKRSVEDTIEAYEALMKYSINEKWNIDPFYLDKNRWNIGIYCKKSSVRLLHADSGEITARMIADIFSGVATTSVSVRNSSVEGYGEAFRLARESKLDYFIIMDFEETEREVSLEAVMYSGRTGTETKRISVFRTGNDRYAGVLRSFRKTVLDVLSVRGKVLKRSGNEVLVDLGKSEGITAGTVLDLVKKGSIRTADKGPGIIFDSKNSLGTIKIEQVGEEISSGRLTQNGFYDRVNIGDEVVIKSVPKAEDAQGQALISDTNPAADENGNTLDSVSMAARELGLVRTPAVIDIIRSIQ